jgi:hypothetical protein
MRAWANPRATAGGGKVERRQQKPLPDDHKIALHATLSFWLRTARHATLEQPTGSANVARLPTCEPGLAGRPRPDEYAHDGCGQAKEAGEMYHVKATRSPWNPRAADIGKSVESC